MQVLILTDEEARELCNLFLRATRSRGLATSQELDVKMMDLLRMTANSILGMK